MNMLWWQWGLIGAGAVLILWGLVKVGLFRVLGEILEAIFEGLT